MTVSDERIAQALADTMKATAKVGHGLITAVAKDLGIDRDRVAAVYRDRVLAGGAG